ncbi:hypothetical protein pb186bvf_012306 [Paramecium bursaria]
MQVTKYIFSNQFRFSDVTSQQEAALDQMGEQLTKFIVLANLIMQLQIINTLMQRRLQQLAISQAINGPVLYPIQVIRPKSLKINQNKIDNKEFSYFFNQNIQQSYSMSY